LPPLAFDVVGEIFHVDQPGGLLPAAPESGNRQGGAGGTLCCLVRRAAEQLRAPGKRDCSASVLAGHQEHSHRATGLAGLQAGQIFKASFRASHCVAPSVFGGAGAAASATAFVRSRVRACAPGSCGSGGLALDRRPSWSATVHRQHGSSRRVSAPVVVRPSCQALAGWGLVASLSSRLRPPSPSAPSIVLPCLRAGRPASSVCEPRRVYALAWPPRQYRVADRRQRMQRAKPASRPASGSADARRSQGIALSGGSAIPWLLRAS